MLMSLMVGLSLVAAPNFQAGWEYASAYKSDAIVVMQDGKVVFEREASSGQLANPHMLASGSKSFCGVAAACLIREGLLSGFDEKVSETLIEWKKDLRKSKITYRQLLSLSSGLTPSGQGEMRRCPDESALLATEVLGEAGTTFRYGPRAFNIFSLAMERKLKGEKLHKYLERKVFRPLGIGVSWRDTNPEGRVQFAGGASCSPRDWAKFGQFVLSGGQIDGRSVCDAKALAETGTRQGAGSAYGLSWWLSPDANPRTGNGPASSFANFRIAAGAGHQDLYILPEIHTVVVRVGPLLGRFSGGEFLKAIFGRS